MRPLHYHCFITFPIKHQKLRNKTTIFPSYTMTKIADLGLKAGSVWLQSLWSEAVDWMTTKVHSHAVSLHFDFRSGHLSIVTFQDRCGGSDPLSSCLKVCIWSWSTGQKCSLNCPKGKYMRGKLLFYIRNLIYGRNQKFNVGGRIMSPKMLCWGPNPWELCIWVHLKLVSNAVSS